MRRFKRVFAFMLALILVIGSSCVTGVARNDGDAKDAALTFIKEVYSDFRTIKNDGEFNQKVESEISETAKDVKQYIKDRKKIREADDEVLERKVTLISSGYTDVEVVFVNGNEVKLRIEAEYNYKEKYGSEPVPKDEDGEDILSGIKPTYNVIMCKEKEVWKIKKIFSNDLTDGNISPENVFSENESLRSNAEVPKYDVSKLLFSSKKLARVDEDVIADEQVMTNDGQGSKPEFTRKKKFYKKVAKPLRKYQDKWWNGRNPKYPNYGNYDCTNYASQVLKASGAPYDKIGGNRWYIGVSSWAVVKALRGYLLKNRGFGLSGKRANRIKKLTCGDLIQIGDNTHTVVVYKGGVSDPIVTAHSSNYKGRYKVAFGRAPGARHYLVFNGYYK